MDQAFEPLRRRGEQMRRKVVGDRFVDESRERAATFAGDFQDVVTALAWGGVWSRDGLSLRDRSLVTVAVLAALHRPSELALHLAGAVRNGLTQRELEEALIQVGVYAGFPATVAANRVGQEVFGNDADRPEPREAGAELTGEGQEAGPGSA